MPLFARLRNKVANSSKDRNQDAVTNTQPVVLARPRWQSNWNSKEVDPGEVAELIHACTLEMKSRAEALDAPFLLLPYRPDTDTTGARIFISNFFKANAAGSKQFRGAALQQELRLTAPVVLCSIMKWCWSRIPNGVVTWPVYEGFRIGEQESHMARNAFSTFIPIGAESQDRTSIIFDFFDVLAAIAAHGKLNGLGGRKLSRLAGWWAFDHSDEGKGFEGGYESWTAAAEASSHLFFAYLRSLSPDTAPSMNVIERIPRSLQALLASTEYPPEIPTLLQRTTPRVVMLVDSVSPTPFALLRRAKHFEYRENDKVLRQFSEFDDPIDALTDENKRVLIAISTTNQSQSLRSRNGVVAKPDESWSAFQNLGFSEIDDTALSQSVSNSVHGSPSTIGRSLRSEPRSFTMDADRPTTPSWADFLSSGFADDEGTPKPTTLLYPPAQVLPPLGNRNAPDTSPQDENLAPGELAAITSIELDDAFWWVWMISLAGEEPSSRKAVFGRCALVETTIMNGRWLIMEEQVKGASPEPVGDVYVAPKKRIFSFTKRTRLGRKKSASKPANAQPDAPERVLSATPSKTSIAPSQHAKIKAAAAALTRSQQEGADHDLPHRRGRHDENPVSTLAVGLQSEAVPALKWTSAYDKNAIRSQYLGDVGAGKGIGQREDSARNSFNAPEAPKTESTATAAAPPAATPSEPAAPVTASSQMAEVSTPVVPKKELPPTPARATPASSPPAQVAAEQAASKLVSTSPQSTPQRSVRSQAMAAFQKDLAVDTPTSQKGAKIERKPVRRFEKVDDHPAFRQSPSPTAANPAAAAAMRAMQSKTQAGADINRNPSVARKQSQNGTIKKLFGSKKDESDGPTAAAELGLARRLSLARKKTDPLQRSAATDSPEVPSMAQGAAAAAVYSSDPSAAELRRSDAQERADAEREFARFDQGPMADMPSAVPIDMDEPVHADATAPATAPAQPLVFPIAPADSQHSRLPQPAASDDAAVADSAIVNPLAGGKGERDFQVPIEDHHDPEIVHDHWAQVRENAAKRATAPRASEDAQSRPSQSMRTDDGDDTSGEETIESRVARIKARVAQLTGNMEGNIQHR